MHVAVPNWRAAKRLLAGADIPWIFAEHISYFTARSLADALRRAGFELLECRSLPMVCDVDYRFAVVVLERTPFDAVVRRFLCMGERRIGELLTDHVQIACPTWRLRLVIAAARVCLRAWPEGLFSALGFGEELRVTARRCAPS